jgi:hypothetical protein
MRISGFDMATGEHIERDMTAEEIASWEKSPIYELPTMEWPILEAEPVEVPAPVEEAQTSTDAG